MQMDGRTAAASRRVASAVGVLSLLGCVAGLALGIQSQQVNSGWAHLAVALPAAALPWAAQQFPRKMQVGALIVGTIALVAVGAVVFLRLPSDEDGKWLSAIALLWVLMFGGFALSRYVSGGFTVRASWIEPLALVLSLAFGVAMSSVIELSLLGELNQFGAWSMGTVGAVAALLLARMRVSHWIVGARLGPIIPVRTGPDAFTNRWEVSDQVLRTYAAEMLPKNALLGGVINAYATSAQPSVGRCADTVSELFFDSYEAALVLMPAQRGVIIAPEGKTEELIAAAGLIGRYLALAGCTVLADNAGESDGPFLRMQLGRGDAGATAPEAGPSSRSDADVGPIIDGMVVIGYGGANTSVSQAQEVAVTPINRSWIKYSEGAFESELDSLRHEVQLNREQAPDASRLRIATNGPDSLGFALGLLAGNKGVNLGSARWTKANGYQLSEGDFPSDCSIGAVGQPRARDRATWYARLLLGSLLSTLGLLGFGALLALTMEWSLLGSVEDPRWLTLLGLVLGVAVLWAVGWVLSVGITSPKYVLDLAGGASSVAWRRRVIAPRTNSKSCDAVVLGIEQAQWVKRRLADIYSAFPATQQVVIEVPQKTDTPERWQAFGAELKSAFKGPKPLYVKAGDVTVPLLPRSQQDVTQATSELERGLTLRSIVEGTGPKQVRDPLSSVELVNLTPHEVAVRWDSGEAVLPSEGVARVNDEAMPVGDLCGVPVVVVRAGQVSGLPEPKAGTLFVVSRIVAQAFPDRDDLLFPFGEIRDADGQIEAVKNLGRF